MILVAAAALFDTQGRLLLTQRPPGKAMAGLWEFPGGKVEAGETPEAALVRELHEEIGIEVRESSLKPLNFASHPYPDFHLLMPVFKVETWVGKPSPQEGQVLDWVAIDRLDEYPAPAADIPLFEALKAERR